MLRNGKIFVVACPCGCGMYWYGFGFGEGYYGILDEIFHAESD